MTIIICVLVHFDFGNFVAICIFFSMFSSLLALELEVEVGQETQEEKLLRKI